MAFAHAGLQYLNARYDDPALGLFLQPDWFEVTRAGVGTNRYSFNDPVNKFDPGGMPRLGVLAGWDDRGGTSGGDGVVALARVEGAAAVTLAMS